MLKLPQMHEVYSNIFLYKGRGAKSAKGPVGRLFEPALRAGQKTWSRMIYGLDTKIFDRIGSTFNHTVPGNAEKCSRTVELLQGIPGVQSALFSVINPGVYIPPHSDPGKGSSDTTSRSGCRVPFKPKSLTALCPRSASDSSRSTATEGIAIGGGRGRVSFSMTYSPTGCKMRRTRCA